MEKRTFLKTGLVLTVGAALSPLIQSCSPAAKAAASVPVKRRSGPFTLPPLPYASDALEPHMDKMTMEIHHGKHHQGYVNNLNNAIAGTAYADYELEDILTRIGSADSERGIRNNAGGHWNHDLYWQIMSPDGGGTASGALATAINASFGGFGQFQEQFANAAKGVFGSGWAWLCVGSDKKLFITTTPNQDNPLMRQLVGTTGVPVLGIDIWEHAYYLKHQNRRPDYINAFFKVVNWKEVGRRFDQAMAG